MADAPEWLPDAYLDAQAQGESANDILVAAAAGEGVLHLPWPTLEDATGPLLPGRLWMLGARTGQGKTTFLLSLLLELVERRIPCYMLGLEQNREHLRLILSALAVGVHPKHVFEGTWATLGPDADRLAEAVREYNIHLALPPVSGVLHFGDLETLTLEGLQAAAEEADAKGCKVFVLDHIDHIRPARGQSKLEALQGCMHLLNVLKKETDLRFIVASQLNRDAVKGDRVALYTPPQLHFLQGAGDKEQIIDVGLGIWRPLRSHIPKGDLARFRAGDLEPRDVIRPNTMGVVVNKQRVRGNDGARVFLGVLHGRVTNTPPLTP